MPHIFYCGFHKATFRVLSVRFMPTAVSSACTESAEKPLPTFRTVFLMRPDGVFLGAGKPLSQDGKAFSAMVRKCCRDGVAA